MTLDKPSAHQSSSYSATFCRSGVMEQLHNPSRTAHLCFESLSTTRIAAACWFQRAKVLSQPGVNAAERHIHLRRAVCQPHSSSLVIRSCFLSFLSRMHALGHRSWQVNLPERTSQPQLGFRSSDGVGSTWGEGIQQSNR